MGTLVVSEVFGATVQQGVISAASPKRETGTFRMVSARFGELTSLYGVNSPNLESNGAILRGTAHVVSYDLRTIAA
jgi:hypothetical protein